MTLSAEVGDFRSRDKREHPYPRSLRPYLPLVEEGAGDPTVHTAAALQVVSGNPKRFYSTQLLKHLLNEVTTTVYKSYVDMLIRRYNSQPFRRLIDKYNKLGYYFELE